MVSWENLTPNIDKAFQAPIVRTVRSLVSCYVFCSVPYAL